jgi:dolichol-phosphate mannosyltransferase
LSPTRTEPDVTIVTPVFNERSGLDELYQELRQELENIDGLRWEWLAVDDHSTDGSEHWLREKTSEDPRVRFIRFASNRGAHIAVAAGLRTARGGCAIVMAGDLQDPPEAIRTMLEKWRSGFQIVWMVRQYREGGTPPGFFPRLWYRMVSRLPGMQELPRTGSDCFLVDRSVMDSLEKQRVHGVSIPTLIRSQGFRQVHVDYEKRERLHGQSKWTLKRKLSHVFNTIVSFTLFPLRMITIPGSVMAGLGALVCLCLLLFQGPDGAESRVLWAVLTVLFLVLGMTLLAINMVGEYLWRVFRFSRREPDYLIEERSADPSTPPPESATGVGAGEGDRA